MHYGNDGEPRGSIAHRPDAKGRPTGVPVEQQMEGRQDQQGSKPPHGPLAQCSGRGESTPLHLKTPDGLPRDSETFIPPREATEGDGSTAGDHFLNAMDRDREA